MTGDRSLTPADAVVAVRSFPRRFRAVFARPDDADERFDPDKVARRPGSDGTTAVEHLLAAISLVESLPGAADTSSVSDDGAPVPELLDRLDRAADAAAGRMDAVPNDAWGPQIEATQDAVAAVAAHIRSATEVLRDVR